MELKDVQTLLAGNTDALAFVSGLAEKAAIVTPELAAEIPKLKDYKAGAETVSRILKESGAASADSLIKDIAAMRMANADLIKQVDAIKKGGNGAVDSAELRALQEQIAEGKKALDALVAENNAAKSEAEKAKADKRESDLKSSVMDAAGKANANQSEEIFILMKARGLVGFKEDGKPFFHKLNEKGEHVDVPSAADLIAWFSATRKDLFAGSKIKGTGDDHRGTGDENQTAPLSNIEARARYRASRMGQ